jgi:hypothetical protein
MLSKARTQYFVGGAWETLWHVTCVGSCPTKSATASLFFLSARAVPTFTRTAFEPQQQQTWPWRRRKKRCTPSRDLASVWREDALDETWDFHLSGSQLNQVSTFQFMKFQNAWPDLKLVLSSIETRAAGNIIWEMYLNHQFIAKH